MTGLGDKFSLIGLCSDDDNFSDVESKKTGFDLFKLTFSLLLLRLRFFLIIL